MWCEIRGTVPRNSYSYAIRLYSMKPGPVPRNSQLGFVHDTFVFYETYLTSSVQLNSKAQYIY